MIFHRQLKSAAGEASELKRLYIVVGALRSEVMKREKKNTGVSSSQEKVTDLQWYDELCMFCMCVCVCVSDG